MSTLFNELSQDQLQSVREQRRGRGEYADVMQQFIDAGIAGAEVPLDRGPLQGKTAKNAVVGFKNARKAEKAPAAFKNIEVVQSKDEDGTEHVYLIRTDNNGATEAEATDES